MGFRDDIFDVSPLDKTTNLSYRTCELTPCPSLMTLFIHLDLDCFFAAVETVLHPELRGVPLCVGGQRGGRGIVTCPNYEARAYGVRTAMSVRAAEQLLPRGAVFLRGNHHLYGEYSRRVMTVLESFTPEVRQRSIDEALMEVGGCLHFWGHDPARMGQAIKDRVRTETGLTISAGVAPNPLCAKIAAGWRKPDGLVVIPHGEVQEFLAPLPVDVVPGIGKKTAPRLAMHGIRTVSDLIARRPPRESWLGSLLRGLLDETGSSGRHDADAVEHSISRDRTFGQDTADREQIESTLFLLTERCCKTLRVEGLAASTVTLKVRFADFTTVQKQETLPAAVVNEEQIFAAVLLLLGDLLPPWRFVRLVGVKVSHLSPLEGQQLTLDAGTSERLHELHRRVDALQERFGEASVRWGRGVGTF